MQRPELSGPLHSVLQTNAMNKPKKTRSHLTVADMEERYQTTYGRFRKFRDKHKNEIGEYLGRGYTPRQVRIMDELWGYHYPIHKHSNGNKQ
jgi:hypothetical protein